MKKSVLFSLLAVAAVAPPKKRKPPPPPTPTKKSWSVFERTEEDEKEDEDSYLYAHDLVTGDYWTSLDAKYLHLFALGTVGTQYPIPPKGWIYFYLGLQNPGNAEQFGANSGWDTVIIGQQHVSKKNEAFVPTTLNVDGHVKFFPDHSPFDPTGKDMQQMRSELDDPSLKLGNLTVQSFKQKRPKLCEGSFVFSYEMKRALDGVGDTFDFEIGDKLNVQIGLVGFTEKGQIIPGLEFKSKTIEWAVNNLNSKSNSISLVASLSVLAATLLVF